MRAPADPAYFCKCPVHLHTHAFSKPCLLNAPCTVARLPSPRVACLFCLRLHAGGGMRTPQNYGTRVQPDTCGHYHCKDCGDGTTDVMGRMLSSEHRSRPSVSEPFYRCPVCRKGSCGMPV
eukprot:363349-Chlamydomonas_euryale.AAC.4